MHYKLILFDFDGTLADSLTWFASIFNDVAVKYNFRQLSESEMQAMRGKTTQEILREIGVSRLKLPFIANHLRELMNRDIAQIKLFAGVPAMLQQLVAANFQLGLISSNSYENVSTVLADSAHLFNLYECGVDLLGKQHKLRNALKQSGISARETVYIGDETRDAEGAEQAKIDFAAATWGYNLPATLETKRPVVLLPNVAAISEWLIGT